MSGFSVEDFDESRYVPEYTGASEDEKDGTFLGRFILAALAQKSMVTNRIFTSGNLLAGISVDFFEKGFGGIREYMKLVERHTNKKTDGK